jgi:hypothetical protein
MFVEGCCDLSKVSISDRFKQRCNHDQILPTVVDIELCLASNMTRETKAKVC